jgi:MYXO-CTERM domain-containing protein
MKKISSIALISASLLATIVSIVPMTSPVAAQVAAPRTGDRDTGTTTTNYERNDDNSGLWGLAGLIGLLGFLGRRKEEDRTTTRRDDTTAYRDPNVR